MAARLEYFHSLISGSQQRVFARWTRVYAKEVKARHGIPCFVLLGETINLMLSLMGNIVLYYVAMQSAVSVADYYAFTIAYGMVSGTFYALAEVGRQISEIGPVWQQIKPVMEAAPEISEEKKWLLIFKEKLNLIMSPFVIRSQCPGC